MSSETVVLKFGSSVLRTDSDVSSVVSEMYRHWRRGIGVVGVISAFKGRTNEIVRLAGRVGNGSASLGALLGVGEIESSAAVALGLERAGLPVHLVSADRIGIIARGDASESEPVTVDTAAIRFALGQGKIVVVPGYVARSTIDNPVVLGRGGSDLTAICLADALGTQAILLKDTGAVFQWDPAEPGLSPRRYQSLDYDDALALGDRVLQPRAVEYAKQTRCAFTVAGLGFDEGTRVQWGAQKQYAQSTHDNTDAPVRVALLGLGTVGIGVAQRLWRESNGIELVGALVRDAKRSRAGVPTGLPVVEDVSLLWEWKPDIVVELVGGADDAFEYVREAISIGADVVTANKALLAQQGIEISKIADQCGRSVLGSAAVGGALPVLELIHRAATIGRVVRVRGVLNGTTNFVLNKLRDGGGLKEAIAEAQANGYAESDSTSDLSGHDAANKLVCIARVLGINNIDIGDVTQIPLDDLSAADARGQTIRQVAELAITPEGVQAGVRLEKIAETDPLHILHNAQNAIVITLDTGQQITRYADGAGRWPTTESVIADIFELARLRQGAALISNNNQ